MIIAKPFGWPPGPLQMHTIDLITITTEPKRGIDLAGLVGPDDIEHRSAWMICRHISTTTRGDGWYHVRIRLTRCPAPSISNLACSPCCLKSGMVAVVRSWATIMKSGWIRPHKAN